MTALPASEVRELLRAAESFAVAAGTLTLELYGPRLSAERKDDDTPVTEADRGAEALLRARIQRRFPDHGVLGEEFGETAPDARVRWIVDPIDGTRSFIRGVPLYGVLIGVEVEGVPAVGVVHLPALRETVAAGVGLGCWWNGRRCRVSETRDLARSLVLTTDPKDVVRLGAGWDVLLESAGVVRTWGDAYGHVLVATGRAEVMIDPVLSPWDAAPLLTLVTEAGGRYTDRSGAPSIHGGSGISTNGHLHERILELVGTRS